jgi:cell division topological specificity factor
MNKKEETEKSTNKDTAKERLQLVLMQDRANVSADFLDMMREEIIEVIKKYVDVDESAIDVKLTNKQNSDGTVGGPALYANIPLKNIKNESRKLNKPEEEKHDNSNSEKNSNKSEEPQENKEEESSIKKDAETENNENVKVEATSEKKENTNNEDLEKSNDKAKAECDSKKDDKKSKKELNSKKVEKGKNEKKNK